MNLAAKLLIFALIGSASSAMIVSENSPQDLTQLSSSVDYEHAQEDFTTAGYSVLQSFPEDVVDFLWHESEGEIVVRSARKDAVRKFIGDNSSIVVSGVDSDVVSYLDRSYVEMEAITAFSDVSSFGIGARYEWREHAVRVNFPAADQSAIWQKVQRVLESMNGYLVDSGVRVTVEFEDENVPSQEATTGGQTYSGCTGAFVANRGAAYGITTAAHCTTKPSSYDGDVTGSTWTSSNNYDLRYTALSGDVPTNKAYVGLPSLREINSVGIVAPNITISKYGKTTGFTLSVKVLAYEGCLTYTSGDTWCSLYSTDNVTAPGDSGGPWFSAFTAYGIHSGASSIKSFFTPVSFVHFISGNPSIKTSP